MRKPCEKELRSTKSAAENGQSAVQLDNDNYYDLPEEDIGRRSKAIGRLCPERLRVLKDISNIEKQKAGISKRPSKDRPWTSREESGNVI